MSYSDYLDVVTRANYGIDSPSPSILEAITPHLTSLQRDEMFTSSSELFRNYFAIPPLKVRGGYLVASFDHHEGTSYLEVHGVSRSRRYYPVRHGAYFQRVPFQAEAMNFAESNWDDNLIQDTWDSVAKIWVLDPSGYQGSTSTDQSDPSIVSVMYVTLNRDYNDLINDWSAPQSILWDKSIVGITTHPVIGREMKGYHQAYEQDNCSLCGGGLGITRCTVCGHALQDNYIRMENRRPLTPRMVEFLVEHGHRFKDRPANAWNYERTHWEQFFQTILTS